MNEILDVKKSRTCATLELIRKGVALKAARISKGLSRIEAAQLSDCSNSTFEQIENARIGFTDDRLRVLIKAIGYKWEEFLVILKDPNLHLRKALERQAKPEEPRRPRRNTFKIICKEARVLKILRERKGISQCKASKLCGYPRCTFGQLEHGRIELSVNRVGFILDALDIPQQDFSDLMQAGTLRDESLAECMRLLKEVEEEKLDSIQLIIRSFIGTKGVKS